MREKSLKKKGGITTLIRSLCKKDKISLGLLQEKLIGRPPLPLNNKKKGRRNRIKYKLSKEEII